LLLRDGLPDSLAAGRSSRFLPIEQLYYKTWTLSRYLTVISPCSIRRLFFGRSLKCLLHQVNNSVAFIASRIDFPSCVGSSMRIQSAFAGGFSSPYLKAGALRRIFGNCEKYSEDLSD
jgi:hypothetical protein